MGHSSSSKASSSTSKSTSSKSSSTSKSTTGSTTKSTKPTTSTKTTTTAPKPSSKTTGGKTYSNQGNVVGGDYAPRFGGGYSPPAGSVVYYRETGFMDYLPWIYLFSHDNAQQQQAVVVQPDGKQVAVKEDTDTGMVIFEWVMLIAIIAIVIGGIVFAAKKLQEKYYEKR